MKSCVIYLITNICYQLFFQIESETSAARDKSNVTLKHVTDLKSRLDALKRKFLENEKNVQKAEYEAERAEDKADQAEEVKKKPFTQTSG